MRFILIRPAKLSTSTDMTVEIQFAARNEVRC